MRTCEACRAATAEGEIALSPAGQWLCRRCHATYQSRAATRQARSAEVARRCTCGNVVMPMRDEHEVGDEGKPLLLQSSLYLCGRCGRQYSTRHPLHTALLVVMLAVTIAVARRVVPPDERILAWIGVSTLGAYVAYEVFKWFRHPRVL